MNNNEKIVFAGKLNPPEKEKSPFSCLVDRTLDTGNNAVFEAKLQTYREARRQRISAGRYM